MGGGARRKASGRTCAAGLKPVGGAPPCRLGRQGAAHSQKRDGTAWDWHRRHGIRRRGVPQGHLGGGSRSLVLGVGTVWMSERGLVLPLPGLRGHRGDGLMARMMYGEGRGEQRGRPAGHRLSGRRRGGSAVKRGLLLMRERTGSACDWRRRRDNCISEAHACHQVLLGMDGGCVVGWGKGGVTTSPMRQVPCACSTPPATGTRCHPAASGSSARRPSGGEAWRWPPSGSPSPSSSADPAPLPAPAQCSGNSSGRSA